MTTIERTWYQGPRLTAYDYAQDPVVAPQGLDFQDAYQEYLRTNPVLRHLGRVTLFRMDDITFVNRSPAFLGNGAAGALMGGPDNFLIPLDIDGEEHRKFRRLLDPLFAPKSKVSRIARLEPVVRDLTNELIDEFVGDGEVEAFARFCAPLPTRIFIDMLGLPRDDLDFFQSFKDGVIRPEGDTPEEMGANAAAAAGRMIEYLGRILDEREASGEIHDDLLSGFLEVEVDGERLAREEMMNIVLLLVIAGLDTVVASLSCFLMFLGRNPSHRQQLVDDPSLIPGAVEELLRTQSPVQQGVRKAIEDVTLPSGEHVRKGELVQAIWAGANLDHEQFLDPLRVDFTRFPNRHIAFASGFHRCLGSHLARLELRVALQEWHRRIPEYSVDESQVQMMNFGVRTVFHLPVTFPKA